MQILTELVASRKLPPKIRFEKFKVQGSRFRSIDSVHPETPYDGKRFLKSPFEKGGEF